MTDSLDREQKFAGFCADVPTAYDCNCYVTFLDKDNFLVKKRFMVSKMYGVRTILGMTLFGPVYIGVSMETCSNLWNIQKNHPNVILVRWPASLAGSSLGIVLLGGMRNVSLFNKKNVPLQQTWLQSFKTLNSFCSFKFFKLFSKSQMNRNH